MKQQNIIPFSRLVANWIGLTSRVAQESAEFKVSYGPDELEMPRVVVTQPKTAQSMAQRFNEDVVRVPYATAARDLERHVGSVFAEGKHIVFTNAEGNPVVGMVPVTSYGEQRLKRADMACA